MRFLIGLLGVLFLGTVFSSSAFAQTGDSTQFEVHAVIAPARSIIIDDQDHITQILSNTNENVTPKVYRETVSTENKASLTKHLSQEYDARLTFIQGSKIGVLYQSRETNPRPQLLSHTKVLSILMKKPDIVRF